MLVDTDHSDTVEALLVVDQDPSPFGQDSSEDGPVDFGPLPDDLEPKLVEPRERGQIRAGETRI